MSNTTIKCTGSNTSSPSAWISQPCEPLPKFVFDWIRIYTYVLRYCAEHVTDGNASKFKYSMSATDGHFIAKFVSWEEQMFARKWNLPSEYSSFTCIQAALTRSFSCDSKVTKIAYIMHVVHKIITSDYYTSDTRLGTVFNAYLEELQTMQEEMMCEIQKHNIRGQTTEQWMQSVHR